MIITPEETMDIGSRIKQARLEAGLSQRQLCGDTITRNMLSLIENGTANVYAKAKLKGGPSKKIKMEDVPLKKLLEFLK